MKEEETERISLSSKQQIDTTALQVTLNFHNLTCWHERRWLESISMVLHLQSIIHSVAYHEKVKEVNDWNDYKDFCKWNKIQDFRKAYLTTSPVIFPDHKQSQSPQPRVHIKSWTLPCAHEKHVPYYMCPTSALSIFTWHKRWFIACPIFWLFSLKLSTNRGRKEGKSIRILRSATSRGILGLNLA